MSAPKNVKEVYELFVREQGCLPEDHPEKILIWCSLLDTLRNRRYGKNRHLARIYKYAERYSYTKDRFTTRRERNGDEW